MAQGTCTIPGCPNPLRARGWCATHWARWRRHGDPLGSYTAPPPRGCSIDGCTRPHEAHGWCAAHYERWRRHGDPLTTLVRTGCSIEGCERKHSGNGLCAGHRRRQRLYGDPLADVRRVRKPCSVDGCENPSKSRGWCGKHYWRWRTYGDPLKLTLRERTGQRACARCGRTPADVPFRADSKAPDRLGAYCKHCEGSYNREHYASNRDARLADNRARYFRNRDRYLAAQKAYALANTDLIRTRKREYYQRHRDANLERARQWRQAHPHRARATIMAWFAANPDRVRALAAKRRMRMRGTTGRVETIDRHAVWTRDNGICGLCAEPVAFEAMHLDHIKPIARGGEHTADNVQPAHPRCNHRKKDREVPRWAFATGSVRPGSDSRSSSSASNSGSSETTTPCSTSP